MSARRNTSRANVSTNSNVTAEAEALRLSLNSNPTAKAARLSLAQVDPNDVHRYMDESIGSDRSGSRRDFDETAEERDEVKEVRKTARKETHGIWIMRGALVALLLAALAVTLVTYTLLGKEQNRAFEDAFSQFSSEVAYIALEHRIEMTQSFKALTEAITAGEITAAYQNFPFFHLPFYERYAKSCIDQGGIEVAVYFPRVQREQIDDWIKYANDTYKVWHFEAHMYQHGNLHNLNPVGYKPYITKAVPGKGLVPYDNFTLPEYYLAWSSYPAPASYGLQNWDINSVPDYQSLIHALGILKNETLATRVRSYAALIGTSFTKEYHDSLHGPIPEGETQYPHTIHFHAVLDRMTDANHPIEDANIVGIVAGGVAWDHSLKNLLAEGVSDITAVIENNCGQAYTFDIDGPRANFVGTGDLHETAYDKYKVVQSLDVHTHPLSNQTPGHCFYWLSLYPTSKFKEAYNTNTPEIFAGVVACTFCLIAVALFVYHTLVEKRNTKLVKTTARTQGVVNQLFPEQIRDQLLAEEANKQGLTPSDQEKERLHQFMSGEIDGPKPFQTHQPKKIIADHFEASTILFADMAGFTKWSSEREPHDVFLLLETLYAAFDETAKRRGVYKVETIGDCYVAVTGVPTFREDHALVMVKFARDIMIRMSVETKKLEGVLGSETGNLKLRAGIHSGPITAGVLRGDRARFQLFGDTMNTASRHESNGVPGRIQLSESTADLIRAAGKETWLVERPDGIEAKGKGRLKTWFLVLGNDKGTDTTINSKTEEGSVQLF